MLKTLLQATALALVGVAGASAVGCSKPQTDETLTGESARVGSMRMELRAGDAEVTTATAVIAGSNGFVTQTHEVDVTGDSGVISIFFGSLPVGRGYTIALTAGSCSGSASFQVVANQITVVPVVLSCGGSSGPPMERGSAQIVGSIPPSGQPGCDPIAQLVAAPSVQDGNGPVTSVELVLSAPNVASSITWTATSRNGGAGTIGGLSGAADTEVTFDCSANGSVSLVAEVTVSQGSGSCVAQGRVGIECLHQQLVAPTPRCGDGVINQPNEQCDGTAIAPGAPAGSTCSPSCTLVVVEVRCSDGSIGLGEECDGTALPPGAPPGSTCNGQCRVVPPERSACAACAAESCVDQRALVDANLAAVDPILDCVLGANWPLGERAASGSCSNGDLLTCYCGALSGQECANAAPSALRGQCVAEVLAGTGCSTSSCVAPIFLNPANPNGKAMQYTQCRQDFCYAECFNL